MTGDDRPTMPPVRLPSDAELAREALAAPLFSRAARLARWSGSGVPVGAGGELLAEQLKEASDHLGLAAVATAEAGHPGAAGTAGTAEEAGEARATVGTGGAGEAEEAVEEGPALAAEAWNLAVDTGLVEVEEAEEDQEAEGRRTEGPGPAAGEASSDEPVGTATPGPELPRLTQGAPADVLEIWREGLETVLADAATPSFESLLGNLQDMLGPDGQVDPEAIDLDSVDWNPQQEADFLDNALGSLYLLTASDPAVASGTLVPLPVLAASMTVPEDMDEPTDEVLEEVSSVMMRLDEQFRVLEPTGLIEYRPVAEELTQETEEETELPEDLDDEDVSRYGMVRLTSLGLYGVRERMREEGIDAPAIGDLAEEDARTLLDALPSFLEDSARAEIEAWLAARTAGVEQAPAAEGAGAADQEASSEQIAKVRVEAARQLLAAARGTDERAPSRRLACQQALSLIGPQAEPALREVLEDRQLGGLARVWLAERGASDVPQPDEEMVFWLTVDTIAAQLSAVGEAAELQELVQGLVDQHTGFFEKAWRVDHPATGDVLEAMGRVHPDRQTAKDARKAAFKARSRATH